MPYVISKDGKFLNRKANITYGKRRAWVDNICNATTWDTLGAAKNAARFAGCRGDVFDIIEVQLTIASKIEKYAID